MTLFRKTVSEFAKGEKEKAYKLFKSDPNAIDCDFESFCESMERVIERSRANMAASSGEMPSGYDD